MRHVGDEPLEFCLIAVFDRETQWLDVFGSERAPIWHFVGRLPCVSAHMNDLVVPILDAAAHDGTDVGRRILNDQLSDVEASSCCVVILNHSLDFIVRRAAVFFDDQGSQDVTVSGDKTAHFYDVCSYAKVA